MIVSLWDRLLLWVDGGGYRDDPEHARAMRASWVSAAKQLGLHHTVGADTFADRIDGQVEGYQVEVSYVSDFDVQKPVTVIRVRVGGAVPNLPILDTKALLEIYDEYAGSRGPLIAEERAWLCGHRYGVGISGNQMELCYRQLCPMYDAADIDFVCTAILKMIRWLDPIRTKVQG